MNKKLKSILKYTGILIVVILLIGFFIYRYFNATFLDFEEDYVERIDFEQRNYEGYSFLDRNSNEKLDIYEDDRQSIQNRVADLISQMTIEEKIHLLKGSGIASAIGSSNSPTSIPGAVGTIVPTPRLGMPTVYVSDGPAGLRIQPTRKGETKTYYCTAFPIATLLASTWNETLVHEVGNAMGNEAVEYGIDVILGPGANIHRHPLCGRNFEYYSEDPLLTGYMGAAIVNGIESNGVGTSVKHFVANNQETDRTNNDVLVSERAMREIYLKGFEIVVERSQPWTIMSSYNKVNGTYTSESEYLLTDVLRNDWGFEGLVMTDWFGGKDAVKQISAGNDLLEPGTKRQWKALTKAVDEGTLSIEDVDRAVSRILTLVLKTKKMQNYTYGNDPDLVKHAAITRQSAAEGIILLENDGTLPIKGQQNVALLGTTSYNFIAGGTGSGDVSEAYIISLEEGLTTSGYAINKAAKRVFEDLKATNKKAFKKPEGIDAMINPVVFPETTYTEAQLEQIVQTADIGILTIGRNAGEGGDRIEKDDFLLSEIEREMISTTAEAFHGSGKKLIVVLNVGGVIETASWKNLPDAILLAWQGGQEGGNSVADILSGKVNPSGKLPMTFPIQLKDHASHANFPLEGDTLSIVDMMSGLLFPPGEKPEAEKIRNKDYTHYDEGVFVGYRHFDKAKLKVSYPFGFGMSYTTFAYDSLQVAIANDTIRLSTSIKNMGDIAGKEILQVYIEKVNSTIDRPIQELKGFAKTNSLEPNAIETVSIEIPVKELRYWDEKSMGWKLEKGIYRVKIGASSRDIRLAETINL